MATTYVTIEKLQEALILQQKQAIEAVRAAAADAGWSGHADDFPAMLQAIRARGRCEAADATRETARSIVKRHGDQCLKFFAASSDEGARGTYAASMRVLRLAREEIEAIQRPDLPWQSSPHDSGLWWFAWPDGEMSMAWQTHTGVITTLWGKRIGDHDDGQWSRAVVPVSPFKRTTAGGGR